MKKRKKRTQKSIKTGNDYDIKEINGALVKNSSKSPKPKRALRILTEVNI